MTFDQHLVLWLLGLPLLAAVVIASLGPQRGILIRRISVGVSLLSLAMALLLAVRFANLERAGLHDTGSTSVLPGTFAPEFVPGSTVASPHSTNWTILSLGPGSIHFYLGVDGLSIWLIVLTALLLLPCVLVSWTHVTERVNEFYAWLMILQVCMIGVFLSFDILLFYVFFEVSLVPLFFMIGIWGGPERQYAARKFFVYTLTGSMLTLLGMLWVVLACHQQTKVLTFSIPQLVQLVQSQLADPTTRPFWSTVQLGVFLLLTAGFAIKVPLMPFHTWLPLAHVEAPTAGSVALAGVLLKVGAYGFLRLCIPLAPDVSLSLGLPLLTGLAAAGVIYGAFTAFAQDDIKRLVAYSSVSHLGLCMLGMFSLTAVGLSGSLMQMINHGLSTGLLFLLVGMLYERYHTRKISDFGGMATRMPLYACCLVFTCLSSVGLPGLNGFVGEVMCIFGIARHEWSIAGRFPILAVAACTGLILGAWYLFTMLRGVLFGPVKEPEHHGHAIPDMLPREWAAVAPLALVCVLIGFYPQPILRTMEPDVQTVARITSLARTRASEQANAEGTSVAVQDETEKR